MMIYLLPTDQICVVKINTSKIQKAHSSYPLAETMEGKLMFLQTSPDEVRSGGGVGGRGAVHIGNLYTSPKQ